MNSGEDLTVTVALHTYEAQEEEIQYDIDHTGQRYEVKKEETAGGMLADDQLAATEIEISTVRAILREIQVQIK